MEELLKKIGALEEKMDDLQKTIDANNKEMEGLYPTVRRWDKMKERNDGLKIEVETIANTLRTLQTLRNRGE